MIMLNGPMEVSAEVFALALICGALIIWGVHMYYGR